MEVRKGSIWEEEVRKAIGLYVEPGACFEIRLIPKKSAKKVYPLHGFFQDAETAIAEMKKLDLREMTVTISLNRIVTAKMATDGRNQFVGGSATPDKDVAGYSNLILDFDPERPSDISSTEEEKKTAQDAASRAYQYLKAKGFAPPVVTMSGNGYHLLYAVAIANDDAGRALVKKFLYTMTALFSAPGVHIDTVNCNPARVVKLPGTWAVKGADIEERPHRMARIIKAPDGYRDNINDITLVQAVADELDIPEEELKDQKTKRKSRYNSSRNGKPDFDLLKWLDEKTDLSYRVEEFKTDEYGSGRKIILDHCPFDETHTAPDSVIFWYDSGAIAFKCLHNSCSGRTWSDVIDKYDPDLKTRMSQEYRDRVSTTYQQNDQRTVAYKAQNSYVPPADVEMTEEAFMERITDMAEIRKSPRPPMVYHRTGYTELDDMLGGGLKAGGLTLISGLSGSCKSTFVTGMMLQLLDDGHKVFCASGELADYELQGWIDLMAAGPGKINGNDKLVDITTDPEAKLRVYTIRDELKPLIDAWANGDNTAGGTGKLYIYKNRYGYNYRLLSKTVELAIKKLGCDVVIVDNLMCLMLDVTGEEKWAAQGRFAMDMHTLAEETYAHIVLCAHPRKPPMDGIIDMYQISGASEVVNAANNIVFVHRTNDFFKRMYQKQYKTTYKPLTPEQEKAKYPEPGNCFKLEKGRAHGMNDAFVPLWYDVRCKRLCNSPKELKIPKQYGWERALTEYRKVEPKGDACKGFDKEIDMSDPFGVNGTDLPF